MVVSNVVSLGLTTRSTLYSGEYMGVSYLIDSTTAISTHALNRILDGYEVEFFRAREYSIIKLRGGRLV